MGELGWYCLASIWQVGVYAPDTASKTQGCNLKNSFANPLPSQNSLKTPNLEKIYGFLRNCFLLLDDSYITNSVTLSSLLPGRVLLCLTLTRSSSSRRAGWQCWLPSSLPCLLSPTQTDALHTCHLVQVDLSLWWKQLEDKLSITNKPTQKTWILGCCLETALRMNL